MPVICPTILANEPHEYRVQLERLEPFSSRVQVDITDGVFTPKKTIAPIQLWWPDDLTVDIHAMFEKPISELETLISLEPHMVIVHAEADGDILAMMQHLKKVNIKAGVCLLKDSVVSNYTELIAIADHVLLFAGTLGSFGGQADMEVLKKVAEVRKINAEVEIGWDGGANASNAKQLSDGGIDVINVGGAIQGSDDPAAAYATLVSSIS